MKRTSAIFCFLCISLIVKADFINLVQADECETIVEVFVSGELIRVSMEIGEQDYQWFSDVIPDSLLDAGYSNEDKLQRWAHFLLNQFILRVGQRPLGGKVNLVDYRKPGSRERIQGEQMDATAPDPMVVYLEILYPLSRQISQLSMAPPIPKGGENSLASIGFIVYHNTVPVNDLRLWQQSETLHLNWEDPWYSRFENSEIGRHHQSSLMSFLYVEPYEIRHEILCRIKDLEAWIDLNYSMDEVIEVEEQDSLKQLIADFLVHRNIVHIDGREVKPIIDRVHFVEANLTGIQILEIPRPLPYPSAIVGVIFAYPHEGIPDEVTVNWDMFSDKIRNVPATSIGPEGPWPYDLQPSDSIMKWKNFLKNYPLPTVTQQKVEAALVHVPLFSIVFVLMLGFLLFRNEWTVRGLSKWRKFFFVLYILLAIMSYPVGIAAEVPFLTKKTYEAPEARKLIGQLLRNTYRAFDFREEGVIYDKLALCNDNDLLQQIYLQTRRSMAIENQGGIEARVNEVVMTTVEELTDEDEGLAYRCGWIARGEVGHWGHTHRRINQYDAIIKIRPVDGAWKMYELELIEEKRL
jgi:hypothetical protein